MGAPDEFLQILKAWTLVSVAVGAGLVSAAVLAGLRIAGFASEPFQAVAHLYMGGLAVGAAVMLCVEPRVGRLLGATWLALVVVEVACFLAGARP